MIKIDVGNDKEYICTSEDDLFNAMDYMVNRECVNAEIFEREYMLNILHESEDSTAK